MADFALPILLCIIFGSLFFTVQIIRAWVIAWDSLCEITERTKVKPSIILACLAWASVFIESWLLILKAIPLDNSTGIPLAIFLITAAMASGAAMPKKDAHNPQRPEPPAKPPKAQ